MKYEIVFWGHVNNGIERYLPLMVSLKRRGVNTLLFYQNFDYKDYFSKSQIRIIEKYDLQVKDYSSYMGKDIFLRCANSAKKFFKKIGISFFYNKFNGLCSKLVKKNVNEELVAKMFAEFGHKISFFDDIHICKDTDYPYGSYCIKKMSDERRIKSFSICPGGTVHMPKSVKIDHVELIFDKIYAPNAYEKEWNEKVYQCGPSQNIISIGDPRNDLNWKKEIESLYKHDVDRKIRDLSSGPKFKILYVCGNLENFNKIDQKHNDLRDMGRLSKEIGNISLFIKPHPRYRNENIIRKIMSKMGVKDFHILKNEPLICYRDHMDLFITSGTSAIQDLLPGSYKKIALYDTIQRELDLKNIFSDILPCFNSYETLYAFVEKIVSGAGYVDNLAEEEVINFCKKWVAANDELDKVIENITNDIYAELNIE
ncbi:MAG: hypothetical protein WCV56_00350 [Candidatus Omnitrophota bacterium]